MMLPWVCPPVLGCIGPKTADAPVVAYILTSKAKEILPRPSGMCWDLPEDVDRL